MHVYEDMVRVLALSLEAFLLLSLRRMESQPDNLKQLTDLSGFIEQSFPASLPVVDSLSTATGYYGVFSDSSLRFWKPQLLLSRPYGYHRYSR